jgi:phage gp37-like protein
LSNLTFNEIEDGIKEKLRVGMPYLKTLKTYGGELAEDIRRLPALFPAAYINYGGSEFEIVDGLAHQETATFNILLCGRNLRDEQSGRKGDGRDSEKGAYRMLEDALISLVNQKITGDMLRLTPVAIQMLMHDKGLVIYGLSIKTSFDKDYET